MQHSFIHTVSNCCYSSKLCCWTLASVPSSITHACLVFLLSSLEAGSGSDCSGTPMEYCSDNFYHSYQTDTETTSSAADPGSTTLCRNAQVAEASCFEGATLHLWRRSDSIQLQPCENWRACSNSSPTLPCQWQQTVPGAAGCWNNQSDPTSL